MTASERAMAQSHKPPRKQAKPDAVEKARKEAIGAIDRNLDGKPRKKPGKVRSLQ